MICAELLVYWWRGTISRIVDRGGLLFPARQIAFAGVATARGILPSGRSALAALSLAAVSISAACFFPETARAQGLFGGCDNAADVAVLPSPLSPWSGAPLRVIVVSEKPLAGELQMIAPDGGVATRSRVRHGGPPYFWVVEVAVPAAGTWHVVLSGGCSLNREIAVRGDQPPPLRAGGGTWPLRASWDRATENLYSAWIEKLFDAPPDAAPSWPALHVVLRDRSRNFLFNHLGLREDELNIIYRPDCADLPYFLRAYFAFKMGLPFGYATCSRGGHGQAPHCGSWAVSHGASTSTERETVPATPAAAAPGDARPPKPQGLPQSFGRYLHTVADAVHSATMRTPLADENTDVYPVALSEDTLRPGTVYADPYGHVLMLVKRIPEANGDAGVLFAVDGQPDGTVARKRYWRGNFLFAADPTLGGPGFKRFRPIVRDRSGALRRLTNAEIAANPDYGDFSLEEGKLGVEDFYDRMDDVLSPQPLDPLKAMEDAIASLDEQVKTRVTSVENGRKYQAAGHGEAEMPTGAAIFETNGAWEDFATPSRDLRLLIAIDVVLHYPERVQRRPGRFAMPFGKGIDAVKSDMENLLANELKNRKFTYTRSDGSAWTLSLRDVIDRASDLEMAYNLNDCVELRWGAPAGSEEASTCKRHAPPAQRAKMSSYRIWFHERRRPPQA
jgi:hypothetical protein